MSTTQKSQQNVPALRFPEFNGEWVERYLGDDIELISGQHLSPDEYSKELGECPYFTGPSDFTNNSDKLTKWAIVESKCALIDDVLITVKGSGVGELWNLQLEKIAMGRQLMAIRGRSSNSELIFHFLATKRNYLAALAAGNMIPGITRADILRIKIKFPALEEQQKIASLLSSVDRKIGQLGKKKSLLEQYKKGMMQRLFSQELRFKDAQGNKFCDWEVKRLGDISTSFSGGTPSSLNREYYSGKIPFIGSGNIGAAKVSQNITENALQNSSAKMVKKGDLLYALYGATSGEIAISRINGAINQAILCIRSDEITMHIYQYLLFKKGRILATYLQGGQGNLSAQIIKSLVMKLPNRIEQQKIADFLSSIDKKIDLVNTELNQIKTFKKGLLQQMFT